MDQRFDMTASEIHIEDKILVRQTVCSAPYPVPSAKIKKIKALQEFSKTLTLPVLLLLVFKVLQLCICFCKSSIGKTWSQKTSEKTKSS